MAVRMLRWALRDLDELEAENERLRTDNAALLELLAAARLGLVEHEGESNLTRLIERIEAEIAVDADGMYLRDKERLYMGARRVTRP